MITDFKERCEGLKQKITRIRSHDTDKTKVKDMATIQKRLEEHISRAKDLTKSLAILRSLDGIPPIRIHGGSLKSLQDKIQQLINRLAEKPDTLKEKNTWAKCDEEARAIADQLETELKKHWLAYATKDRPRYEDFEAFRNMQQCVANFRELDVLRQDLDALGRRLPIADEPAQAVVKLRRMHELFAELDFGNEPPDMIAFLRKCYDRGGAPLDELTPEVLQWLRKQNYLQNLRVSASGIR